MPALTKEEEYKFAVHLRDQGDLEAADSLITANLKNVVWIAMDYSGYGLPLEDTVQEGIIGLMIAVKKFDPYKGYRLMPYAIWWIKAKIYDYILRFFSQVKLGTTRLQKQLFYGLNRITAEEEVMDEHIKDMLMSTRHFAESGPSLPIGEWRLFSRVFRMANMASEPTTMRMGTGHSTRTS